MPAETYTNTGLHIRRAGPQDIETWDLYVNKHPGGTVFHLNAWKAVIESSFHHKSLYFIAEKHGSVCGIFPVFEIKSWLFGHYLVSIPFAEVGGCLADGPEIERALIEEASRVTDKKNALYLEIRNRNRVPDLDTKTLYYNFSKEISVDHDENLRAIPRKSRAMVRNAIKKGLVAEFGHHLLSKFYDILALNYHRLGTPVFSKKMFTNFLKYYPESSDILLVNTKDGKKAAAVLFFIHKNRILPYYAGSDFSLRHLGPNDFMYWELMKYGADSGISVFDYGRSKEGTGSFRFKKHWGFRPEPLSYQYYLSSADEVPNLSPANPKYERKIRMWQRMPHFFTRFAGPFISRNIA